MQRVIKYIFETSEHTTMHQIFGTLDSVSFSLFITDVIEFFIPLLMSELVKLIRCKL